MNVVVLIGRPTKDPLMTATTNGLSVAKFHLAVQDEKSKRTDFPSITAYGKLAEVIESYVHKGDLISIMGHIQTGSYEKDGVKFYTTEVVAEKVKFLNAKGETKEMPEEQISGFEKLTGEDIPFED